MKRDILTLFIILFSLSLGAQVCTEQASDFGNNQVIASYNVSGDVEVLFDIEEGTVTLNLGSNYSTADGPDVRAYLVQSGGLSDAQLQQTSRIQNLVNVEFGLTTRSGEQTFTIDAPDDIESYDKVFFWCLQFSQFWDFGTIASFPAEGCPAIISSTREELLAVDAFKIFPNPATDYVNVALNDNISTTGEIGIFNIIGQQMMRLEGDINQNININRLDAGVYTLQVRVDGKSLTRKLVVQD